MNLASIGMRIKRARLDRGFSQAEAALRIGISRSFLATVERGESGVSTRVLAKIAEAFGVSMSWFAVTKVLDGRLMRSAAFAGDLDVDVRHGRFSFHSGPARSDQNKEAHLV